MAKKPPITKLSPVSQIPNATPFQKRYVGTTVSGGSGIVPYFKKFG